MPPYKRSHQHRGGGGGGGHHNKKTKVVDEFKIPVLDLTRPIFSDTSSGTEVQVIFDNLLNEITAWMDEQVGRPHFVWAKERVDELRARLVKEGQVSLSPEELVTLEAERTSLTTQCHEFVRRIVEKLQEAKAAIQLTIHANQQDLEATRAQLLQLEQRDLLVTLLQDMDDPIKTSDLAEIITKKLGMGFSKRFNGKKLNHAFNDFPDTFEQQKTGWKLKK